jgi:hypothetical protein
MTSGEVAVIACDESASEGENLMGSAHPVFVHGSVNLTLDDAHEFLEGLRVATRTQAPEMKSKTILLRRNRAALLDALPALDGRANIYFVDKTYFITAKLIALLVAEHGERYGVDVDGSGLGRHLADTLHRDGPAAVGSIQWSALLTTYNNLIRSYLRQGSTPPAAQSFIAALANARKACRDPKVATILEDIWEARHLTREYEDAGEVVLREMDPMAPSLAAVSMTWAMRLKGAPFEFLVDNYYGLTERVCEAIVTESRAPLSVGPVQLPRADLRGISLIDSKLDARVQVADLLAGVGREVARMAVAGTFDDDLQNLVHQMLDYNVMSSGGSPVDALIERAPLTYVEEWARLQRAL